MTMISYTVKTTFDGKKPLANVFHHYADAFAHANAMRLTGRGYGETNIITDTIELLKISVTTDFIELLKTTN